MRSKLHLKGHPLHPILVAFPIAFFIGTLLFDILGWLKNKDAYWQTGMYLEVTGIISALLAAVPGIIDYFFIVPPRSSGKKRAMQHGILNISLLIIFIIVWFYRQNDSASSYIILIAETIGVILLGVSGWLGGTLVHRNQIGIDHRYAGAGKWKEKYLGDQKGDIEVAASDELKTDQMMLIHINKKRIVIGKTKTEYVAFDDYCTHRGGTLADGVMICGMVQCPWHGSQFDCKTGAVKAGPAKKSIPTYILKEQEAKIYITL
ncbi:MAG: Rieske 2Fe-2S domain-containing protein [Bacteroidota bacterium]|nr:Rieske 2Fe-2S domain-containing protein [Bacteroidota bacterium]